MTRGALGVSRAIARGRRRDAACKVSSHLSTMALSYGKMPTPPALSPAGCARGEGVRSKDPAAARTAPSPRRSLLAVPPPLCFARVSCSLHRPCRVPFLAPSQNGNTAFHLAAENGHVAAMELLLAHGADPNAKDGVRAPLGA